MLHIIIIAIRQLVILFDLKTSTSDGNKPYGSLAVLNSTASTYLHTNSSDIEVEPITVNIYLYISNITLIKISYINVIILKINIISKVNI